MMGKYRLGSEPGFSWFCFEGSDPGFLLTQGRPNNAFVSRLEAKYGTTPPKGFVEYCRANGADDRINTCAVRLAHAIFLSDPQFFKDVAAKSKTEWYGLPTRASDLAIILNAKLKKAQLVKKSVIAGKKGAIFFDTIPGYGGTGHISLWNGTAVVDGGDYFQGSPRAYFWELPN